MNGCDKRIVSENWTKAAAGGVHPRGVRFGVSGLRSLARVTLLPPFPLRGDLSFRAALTLRHESNSQYGTWLATLPQADKAYFRVFPSARYGVTLSRGLFKHSIL